MNKIRYERRRYTAGPTPIEKLERLSEVLGGPAISIKRDDQLGLTVGETRHANWNTWWQTPSGREPIHSLHAEPFNPTIVA